MNDIMPLIRLLAAFIPMVLLVLLNGKNNLRKPYRSRQYLMPVAAVIYTAALIVLLKTALSWCSSLVELLTEKIEPFGSAGSAVNDLIDLARSNILASSIVALNTLAMTGFLFVKRIIITLSAALCRPGSPVYEMTADWFYENSNDESVRYVKQSTVEARRFLKVFYVTAVILSFIMLLLSMFLYQRELLQVPFFPVLGFLVIGEIYFYINGLTEEEAQTTVSGEGDSARKIFNYSSLRKVFRGIFGDKLLDDSTTAHQNSARLSTAEELIEKYRQNDSRIVETYGRYMDKYRMEGHVLDQNYLASGLDLLQGKSILFNNPFYQDLIPYAFYAMNHELLCNKKVMIILGRHGIEDEVTEWCRKGLRSVTNVEGMWHIGVLGKDLQNPDVGIITRSDVQNLSLHRENSDFFRNTEYVMLIEPSKLISTAQIGLNSIVRYCRSEEGKKLTFCSVDRNCDGLVDALSHALMTSISEVSPTEAHDGVCSYMCWMSDGEYWQHRLLPNISRYLGNGTELSFLALKNNISKTEWYGGERFPVTDIRWIAKQYYSELLTYAGLPVSQELMDNVFRTSPNLWNVGKSLNTYLTVEDESFNVFEMKREFSTRASGQSFVNIVSTPYLLCDYMTENQGIFNADPKAVPFIVSDYVTTKRNVLLRLCVQMASGFVWDRTVRKELMLADIIGDDPVSALWNGLCACYNPIGEPGNEIRVSDGGHEYKFDKRVISGKQKYNVETGRDEVCYFIDNAAFIRVVLNDLSNARYIAEEEKENSFLGTECRGQIFQKYLPGQFFTLCGKYYEMLNITFDGRVLVRRAADHISGRPAYRQERIYTLRKTGPDPQMGSVRHYDRMEVARMFADVSVKTAAYWDLPSYQDFAHGRRVEINGIPERHFNSKWILRIRLDGSSEKVRYTLADLLNEVFRTLFAENQDMIIAATKSGCRVPLTYGIEGECAEDDAIYIIEDCQYDIGLLTAVERNIDRIFRIITDYLRWNKEEIIRSENGTEETRPDFSITPEQLAEEEAAAADTSEKKTGFFRKLIEKIKSLFGKKKKPEETVAAPEAPAEEQAPEASETEEAGEKPEEGSSAVEDEEKTEEESSAGEAEEKPEEERSGEETEAETEAADPAGAAETGKKPGFIRRIIDKLKSLFSKKPKQEATGDQPGSEETAEEETSSEAAAEEEISSEETASAEEIPEETPEAETEEETPETEPEHEGEAVIPDE